MNENQQKLEFAAELLKDKSNPFKAALTVFGSNTAQALRVYLDWAADPIVKAEMDRLIKTRGKKSFILDLEDTAALLLRTANEALAEGDRSEFRQIMKLFTEVMGFIQKPGTTINNNNTVTRVMEVLNHGTEADWETQLRAQQLGLTRDSAKPN